MATGVSAMSAQVGSLLLWAQAALEGCRSYLLEHTAVHSAYVAISLLLALCCESQSFVSTYPT
jgi:hypothetical protein